MVTPHADQLGVGHFVPTPTRVYMLMRIRIGVCNDHYAHGWKCIRRVSTHASVVLQSAFATNVTSPTGCDSCFDCRLHMEESEMLHWCCDQDVVNVLGVVLANLLPS